MRIKVFTDGGARGNPGMAGAGVVVKTESGKIIFQKSIYLGTKTNNEAEYGALILALEWVKKNKESMEVSEILINSDSELLVRQMEGRYKVKAKNLKPLWSRARDRVEEMGVPVFFASIKRELNILADELANRAMDSGK
jgi:ribonuclease HI